MLYQEFTKTILGVSIILYLILLSGLVHADDCVSSDDCPEAYTCEKNTDWRGGYYVYTGECNSGNCERVLSSCCGEDTCTSNSLQGIVGYCTNELGDTDLPFQCVWDCSDDFYACCVDGYSWGGASLCYDKPNCCANSDACDQNTGKCKEECPVETCETCNCGTISDGCGGTLTCGDICEGGSSCYEGFCICDELYYLSCDGDPCNYDCEVDSRTNIEHCGECNYDCREENPDRTPYYENEYCEDRECKIRCRGTPCSKGEYKCIDDFDGKTYYCVNSTPFYFSSSFVFNPLGSKGTEIYCEENEYYRNGYCTDKTATNLDHCYFDCEKTGMASLFDERNACGGERGYCNFTNGARVSNIGIQNLKIAPEVDKSKIKGQGSFPHAHQIFGYNYKVFEKNPDNYSTVGFSLLAKFDSKGKRTESNLYWDICNNNNRLVERYSIPDFFSTESASLYSKTYNCECLNITSGNYKFAICKTPPTSSSTKTEIIYSV